MISVGNHCTGTHFSRFGTLIFTKNLSSYSYPKNIPLGSEKMFLFEECLYIIKKWNQRDEMDVLVSTLATMNNRSFLSKYLVDLAKLDKEQLNQLLKIGGSNCKLSLRAILTSLEGKTEPDKNIKHLLQHRVGWG